MHSHYPAPGEHPAAHPLAALFPMMTDAEIKELAADIKQNGLRDPLVLLDNQILDGRNRLLACVQAKTEPAWRFFDPKKDGKSPLRFVLGKNLKRRHLTPSQAAAVAAESLPLFEAEAAGRQKSTQFRIVGETGVTHTTPAFLDGAETKADETDGETEEQMAERLSRIDDSEEAPTPATVVVQDPDAQLPPEDDGSQVPTRKTGSTPRRSTAPARQKVTPTTPAPSAGPGAPEHAGSTSSGRARDAAAASVGVSSRSVGTAAHIQKADPEKFAEVKKGTKTLHRAAIEVAMETPEIQDALMKIRRVCGQSLHDAVKDQTRLKGTKEILAYAALADERMLETRGLIDAGWSVKDAVKYRAGDLCRTHKIGDLINRAIAGGGQFTLEIEGFLISVSRKTDGMPATAAADAAKKTRAKARRDA